MVESGQTQSQHIGETAASVQAWGGPSASSLECHPCNAQAGDGGWGTSTTQGHDHPSRDSGALGWWNGYS